MFQSVLRSSRAGTDSSRLRHPVSIPAPG
jgi:hypothetical protein